MADSVPIPVNFDLNSIRSVAGRTVAYEEEFVSQLWIILQAVK